MDNPLWPGPHPSRWPRDRWRSRRRWRRAPGSTLRRPCKGSEDDGAFSVSLDSQIATRAQQGVSAKASLNRIPKLPPDRRAASKTAKLCLRFQNAKKQHACLGMRCLRGHQRHGAFSRWLGAARSLCHLLRIKYCQQRGARTRKRLLRPQSSLQPGGSGLRWWHAARLGPEQHGVRPQRP